MRLFPDPFPSFEGGVRQRQTTKYVHAMHAHFRLNSAPFSNKGCFWATRKQPGYVPGALSKSDVIVEPLSERGGIEEKDFVSI